MKKIILTLISAVLAVSAATSVSAAEVSDNNSVGLTLDDFMYHCRVVGTDTIPDHTARLYTNGSIGSANQFGTPDFFAGITFVDCNTYSRVSRNFDSTKSYEDIYLPNSDYYMSETTLSFPGGGSSGSGPDFYLNNSGGTYRRFRAKLSAYSDYFNTDGTHTKDGHNFNFTLQDGGYFSSLIVCSGGAVTAVTPDNSGFVEFYCSTKIGVPTEFSTSYCKYTPLSTSCGGGPTSENLHGFMVGDIDANGNITINDVTMLQKYIAGLITLDELALLNSDVNFDGNINIEDVTDIQKYIAGSK